MASRLHVEQRQRTERSANQVEAMAPRGILQHAVPDAATDGLGDGGAIGLGAEPKTPNGKVTPSPTAPRATPASSGCPSQVGDDPVGIGNGGYNQGGQLSLFAAADALGLRPSSATCLRKALPFVASRTAAVATVRSRLSFISLASWWNLASASKVRPMAASLSFPSRATPRPSAAISFSLNRTDGTRSNRHRLRSAPSWSRCRLFRPDRSA